MVSATQQVSTAATAASAAVPPARRIRTPISAVAGCAAATPAETGPSSVIRRSVGAAGPRWLTSASMTAAGPSPDVRQADALPRRTLAGYALGSLVTGAFGTVPGLLLLPYLTDTLGVAAGVAGLLVLRPKAWDVLVNPVAGRLSDARGDRRPFLLVAGLVLGVLFAAMFAGPVRSGAGAGAYVALAFL